MYKEKLKIAIDMFYSMYPDGFSDIELDKIRKRHKTEKMQLLAKDMFCKDNFARAELICENYAKIVSKSSLISYFEKPKVKQMVASMSHIKKDMFSISLYETLFGDMREGLEGMAEVLADYNLAKWSLVTIVMYYYHREKEYFIKPTTTKNILKYFDAKSPTYKPKPTFEFYEEYKNFLESLKKDANIDIKDNAAFTGLFMIAMPKI